LISAQLSPEEIARKMDAESLGFLSIDGLIDSLGRERSYSLVSFDGNYFAGGNVGSPGCSSSC